MNMENKDFEKAYRIASKVMYPDKVRDQNDEKLNAIMPEQFRKVTLAKEVLVVPIGNPLKTCETIERRNTYFRRFLWTEQELAHEGSNFPTVDNSMLGEKPRGTTSRRTSTKSQISTVVRSECSQALDISKATYCNPSVAAVLTRQIRASTRPRAQVAPPKKRPWQ